LGECEVKHGMRIEKSAICIPMKSAIRNGPKSPRRSGNDPVGDPIRNDPGFQELLAGKELIGPSK